MAKYSLRGFLESNHLHSTLSGTPINTLQGQNPSRINKVIAILVFLKVKYMFETSIGMQNRLV